MHMIRHVFTGPAGALGVEQMALAMLDMAVGALCLLSSAFGAELAPLLVAAAPRAPYGTPAELQAKLVGCED